MYSGYNFLIYDFMHLFSPILWIIFFTFFFFKTFTYFQREGKGGMKGGRETSCVRETSITWLSSAPNWRRGLQHRPVSWLGVEGNLWFTGQHPTHWATPARAVFTLLLVSFKVQKFLSLMNSKLPVFSLTPCTSDIIHTEEYIKDMIS